MIKFMKIFIVYALNIFLLKADGLDSVNVNSFQKHNKISVQVGVGLIDGIHIGLLIPLETKSNFELTISSNNRFVIHGKLNY